jgi:hypothetical protein
MINVWELSAYAMAEERPARPTADTKSANEAQPDPTIGDLVAYLGMGLVQGLVLGLMDPFHTELAKSLGITVGVSLASNLATALMQHPLLAPQALTSLAVFIGGHKRTWQGEELAADLAVGSALGHSPNTPAQLRYATGLVAAAIRLRARDLVQALVRVLDWTLAEPRTEILVALTTLCSAGYFLFSSGFVGLMANFDNVLAIATIMAVPALWLRRARGVLPERHRDHTSL